MGAPGQRDAKVSMMKLGADGRPGSPQSVLMQPAARYVDERHPSREEHWKYRQRWPHSHCCVTEPYSGRIHFVAGPLKSFPSSAHITGSRCP